MKTLLIDTRDNRHVVARLEIDGKEFTADSKSENQRPESILLLIEEVCQMGGIDIREIDSISVEEGPGSYTGLKVGASVANALSFALQKKVNGLDIGVTVEPRYE